MIKILLKFCTLLLLLCYSCLVLQVEGDDKKEYESPGTVTYPVGDEEFNNDILGMKQTRSGEGLQKFEGRCTRSAEHKGAVEDSHISCHGEGGGHTPDVIYSSDNIDTNPEIRCKKCDLTVTPDSKGVIVRCQECFDLNPGPKKKKFKIMSLPSPYVSIKSYFEDVVKFLLDYEWTFAYPNTHILINKVFNNFDQSWREYFKHLPNEKLNSLSLGNYSDDCPQSLKAFLHKINALKPTFVVRDRVKDSVEKNWKLCVKKQHEIAHLAPFISSICKEQNIEYVVDVGSGHGYLSRYLHNKYGLKVLGIDTCEKKVDAAQYFETGDKTPSADDVKYVVHHINQNSAPFISATLMKSFPESINKKTCIVGLHACADLSITILEVFHQLDCADALVIMPCCYHRLKQKDGVFKNFPASDALKQICVEMNAYKFLQVPFLRIACQQTSSTFSKMNRHEHERHASNCFFRAILQEVSEEGNLVIKRKKRKSGRSLKNDFELTFENYLNNLTDTHELFQKTGDKKQLMDDAFKQKMLEKYNIHKGNFYLVEALATFQTIIQSICENLILLDRVMFLREKGLQSSVNKVTDDCISPRCYALVARKH